ncbi:diguanylate cyclase domain-containing protein [Butyrivibrio sp. AE3004]|uniref:diguanylate cyclase domain-containing protein n=1 Tax=Butyrivibrio sp. AE3004 TaxID=1506994 RepID=UPI000494CFB8|nr:diguanylate cyclase [Butyrivibrio sp. AE3004]
MRKKTDSLLFKFAIIFVIFTMITIALSTIITYASQNSIYHKQCEERIQDIAEYLEKLMIADGDEFVVILENDDYKSMEDLVAECNNQLDRISNDESLEPWERISAAIGFARFDPSIDNGYENVFKRADKAMYVRKRQMKAIRID